MTQVSGLDPTPMIDWMRERQRIFRKRQRGEKGELTTDYAMKTFRFCNVFRELDTVTAWIRENWRTPYANDPYLPFAMGVARYFNHPPTLEAIGFPGGDNWDPAALCIKLNERSNSHKIFSPAYIISPCGSTKPKINRVIEDYLVPVREVSKKWIVNGNLQATWANIEKHEGFGPFISYEVVSDLRHTPRLQTAVDAYTWANPGPGAARGLQRLLGKKGADVRRKLPANFMLDAMRYLLDVCKKELWNDDMMFKKLEMRDIEHSLCETDKWLRVATNEGSPKERYCTK